jgi:hypothetical protein
MKAEIQGLFFNETGVNTPSISSTPSTELTIEKDVLDRSSKFILGRFTYQIDDPYQLVWQVTIDGKQVVQDATNLPTGSGTIDTTLFKWPNSAWANQPIKHTINVNIGLRKGFWQSVYNLSLPAVTWMTPAMFPITLLPSRNL